MALSIPRRFPMAFASGEDVPPGVFIRIELQVPPGYVVQLSELRFALEPHSSLGGFSMKKGPRFLLRGLRRLDTREDLPIPDHAPGEPERFILAKPLAIDDTTRLAMVFENASPVAGPLRGAWLGELVQEPAIEEVN